MAFLNDRLQKILSVSALTLGGLLMLGGVGAVVINPQIKGIESAASAYDAGNRGEVYIASPTSTGRALGLLSIALGIGPMVLGVILADPQPVSMAPSPVLQAIQIDDKEPVLAITEAALRADLQIRIAELLAANDWLRACLKAHTVVLCGDAGSGKTTIAADIVLLRELLWGWDTLILDRHAEDNEATWLNGNLAGKEGDCEILDNWDIGAKRCPKDKHRSIAIDEFSGYGVDPKSPLASIASKMVLHGTANARKWGHHLIYLVHGEENGMLGGEHITSGWQSSLKDRSVGIKLIAEYDEWGEPCFTGQAAWKAGGKPWVNSSFEPFAVPKLLKPGALKAELSAALELLGIEVRLPSMVATLDDGAMAASVDATMALTDLDVLRSRLEKLSLTTDHPVDNNPHWKEAVKISHATELLAYIKKNELREIDPRRLQMNWGKGRDLNAASIRLLLMHFVACLVGHWEGSAFVLNVSVDDIPN